MRKKRLKFDSNIIPQLKAVNSLGIFTDRFSRHLGSSEEKGKANQL
jgi:hypothetical protein